MKRAAALALCLTALLFAILRGAGHWHPSLDAYPRQGIDVSHHQGAIDWRRLPGQQVSFAYIKATEGGDYADPLFARNWRASRAAHISHGAYHFFTLCRSGEDQARNFIRSVPAEADALPPVVDLEYLGNCGERPSVAAFHRELTRYLALVEAHYGKPATLYLTQEFNEAYRISAKLPNPLWLRSLVIEPRFGGRHWTIWQASNFRRLDGIEGRVDWNVMR